MHDIIPNKVITILRDRYAAGVANAEAFFGQSSADEDSVTGALGQALAIADPINFVIDMQEFTIEVSYRKLRGRGPRAPEKIYGSDGLFQIKVKNRNNDTVATKGLPFQAKINWKGKNNQLLEQAQKMEEFTPNGIVIDFGPNGYKACTAVAAISSSGNRAVADRHHMLKPLSQILSRDFLDCTVGTRGLYYDSNNEIYGKHSIFNSDLHVISTKVTISPWG